MLSKMTSQNLTECPVQHGFFTRQGGISAGVYESLNCARGTKEDTPDNVTHNRAMVAQALRVSSDNLITMSQVHSSTAVLVTSETKPSEADGMVTTHHGIALGVLTADCAPVLLCDPVAGVIGAAHAGWRGAVDGIVQKTVQLMCGQGATLSEIRASIGPTIQQKNYEVDAKFYQRFLQDDPGNQTFFKQSSRKAIKGPHHMFDLPGFVEFILRRAGVVRIEIIPHCTYESEDMFFSYRRNTHENLSDYGRQISVIALV